MLKGIAASAGVSIAKAYKLESPKLRSLKKKEILQLKLKNSMQHSKRQKQISRV